MVKQGRPRVELENLRGTLLDFWASTHNIGNPQNYPSANQGNIHVSPLTMSWTEGVLDWDYAFSCPRRDGLCVSQVSAIQINRTLVSPLVSRIAPPG